MLKDLTHWSTYMTFLSAAAWAARKPATARYFMVIDCAVNVPDAME